MAILNFENLFISTKSFKDFITAWQTGFRWKAYTVPEGKDQATRCFCFSGIFVSGNFLKVKEKDQNFGFDCLSKRGPVFSFCKEIA